MNFERGLDPHESLKIGLKANPISISHVGYNIAIYKENYYMTHLLDGHQIMQLFRALERNKNYIKRRKIKAAYSIIEEVKFYLTGYDGVDEKYLTIKEIIGKYIEFQDHIFLIDPKLDLTEPIYYEV